MLPLQQVPMMESGLNPWATNVHTKLMEHASVVKQLMKDVNYHQLDGVCALLFYARKDF